MFTIEKTVQALIERFQASNWQPIMLTIRATGDTVTVTPCFYGNKLPEKPSDCEYFLMDCPGILLNGCDRIEEVADTLNRFKAIKAKDTQDKVALHEFYKNKLDGVTDQDWTAMRTISKALYEMWQERKETRWEDFLQEVKPVLSRQTKQSFAAIDKAIELSDNFDYYADTFKNLYGYYPRLHVNAEEPA